MLFLILFFAAHLMEMLFYIIPFIQYVLHWGGKNIMKWEINCDEIRKEGSWRVLWTDLGRFSWEINGAVGFYIAPLNVALEGKKMTF